MQVRGSGENYEVVKGYTLPVSSVKQNGGGSLSDLS